MVTTEPQDFDLDVTPIPDIRVTRGKNIPYHLGDHIVEGNIPYHWTLAGRPSGIHVGETTGILSGTTSANNGQHDVSGMVVDLDLDTVDIAFRIEVQENTLHEMQRLYRSGVIQNLNAACTRAAHILGVVTFGNQNGFRNFNLETLEYSEAGNLNRNGLDFSTIDGLADVNGTVYGITRANDWFFRLNINAQGMVTGYANIGQFPHDGQETYRGLAYHNGWFYTSKGTEAAPATQLARFAIGTPGSITTIGSYAENYRRIFSLVSTAGKLIGYDNSGTHEFVEINPATAALSNRRSQAKLDCHVIFNHPGDDGIPSLGAFHRIANKHDDIFGVRHGFLDQPSITSVSINGLGDLLWPANRVFTIAVVGTYTSDLTIAVSAVHGTIETTATGYRYTPTVANPPGGYDEIVTATVTANGDDLTVYRLDDPVSLTQTEPFRVDQSLPDSSLVDVVIGAVPATIRDNVNFDLDVTANGVVGDALTFTSLTNGFGSTHPATEDFQNPNNPHHWIVRYTPVRRGTSYTDQVFINARARGLGTDAVDGSRSLNRGANVMINVIPEIPDATFAGFGVSNPPAIVSEGDDVTFTAAVTGLHADDLTVEAEVVSGHGIFLAEDNPDVDHNPPAITAHNFLYRTVEYSGESSDYDVTVRFTATATGDGTDAHVNSTHTMVVEKTFSVRYALGAVAGTLGLTSERERRASWPAVPNADSYQAQMLDRDTDDLARINDVLRGLSYGFVPPVMAETRWRVAVRARKNNGDNVGPWWYSADFTLPEAAAQGVNKVHVQDAGVSQLITGARAGDSGAVQNLRHIRVRSGNIDNLVWRAGTTGVDSNWDRMLGLGTGVIVAALRFNADYARSRLWDYDSDQTNPGAQQHGQLLSNSTGMFSDTALMWISDIDVTDVGSGKQIHIQRADGSLYVFNAEISGWADNWSWTVWNETTQEYVVFQANGNTAVGAHFITYRTSGVPEWREVASQLNGTLNEFFDALPNSETVWALLHTNVWRPTWA